MPGDPKVHATLHFQIFRYELLKSERQISVYISILANRDLSHCVDVGLLFPRRTAIAYPASPPFPIASRIAHVPMRRGVGGMSILS